MLEMLLKSGVDVDAVDGAGNSPLLTIAMNGKLKIGLQFVQYEY